MIPDTHNTVALTLYRVTIKTCNGMKKVQYVVAQNPEQAAKVFEMVCLVENLRGVNVVKEALNG